MADEDSIFDFEILEMKLRELLNDQELDDDYKIIRPPNGGQKNPNFPRRNDFPSTSFANQQRIKFEELYKEYEANKNSAIFSSMCTFCKQNCEHPSVYLTHKLKENGVVKCPILRKYVCPKCSATGDNAHTQKYCPLGSLSSKRVFHISQAAKLRMSNGRKKN